MNKIKISCYNTLMFMKELKATIFKSRFHVTRFLGLLIIPFLYAFTFTLAFFDPFGHTQNIPMKVVTIKWLRKRLQVLLIKLK